MDANHLLSIGGISTLLKNQSSASVNSAGQSTFDQLTLDVAQNSMASNGFIDYSNSPIPIALSKLGMPIDPISEEGYDQTTQGAVNFGGMMKNLGQVLNVTTFNDSEFKNITGYYTAENAKGQPMIVL